MEKKNDQPVEGIGNDELIKSLKAQAYDCLVQVEYWQQKLRETNEQLKNLLK